MKFKFSTRWKRSTSPSKQRKYSYTAPLHIKQKLIHAHLSPELRKKHGVRSIGVRRGDRIKVLRGQFAKREGKINRLVLRRERLYVDGIELIKKDGTKVPYPLHSSNVMIMELSLNDKKRKEKINVHQKTKPIPK